MQQCLARFHVSRYRADITNSSLSQVATKKEKRYCLWVIQLHFGQSLTAVKTHCWQVFSLRHCGPGQLPSLASLQQIIPVPSSNWFTLIVWYYSLFWCNLFGVELEKMCIYLYPFPKFTHTNHTKRKGSLESSPSVLPLISINVFFKEFSAFGTVNSISDPSLSSNRRINWVVVSNMFDLYPDFWGKWSNLTCAYFSNGLVETTTN